jgi:hypothetical protein
MVPNKINKEQTGFSLPYLFVFPALALSILIFADMTGAIGTGTAIMLAATISYN